MGAKIVIFKIRKNVLTIMAMYVITGSGKENHYLMRERKDNE